MKIKATDTISITDIKKFKKRLDSLSVDANREYPEMGRLYVVRYTPNFMQKWPNWLIIIGCFVLNHLPNRFSSRLERYFNSR